VKKDLETIQQTDSGLADTPQLHYGRKGNLSLLSLYFYFLCRAFLIQFYVIPQMAHWPIYQPRKPIFCKSQIAFFSQNTKEKY